MLEFLGQVTASEVLLNSTILAVVFRAVWEAFSEISNRVRQFFSKKNKSYEIILGPYKPEFHDNVNFACLLVRYNTDKYLQALASEKYKYDGRLQNRIIPITIKKSGNENAYFSLELPIHQRIGTQFKCFADVEDSDNFESLNRILNECNRIYGVSRSSSQFRNRIYFLLNDFDTCETADGVQNNICFPV